MSLVYGVNLIKIAEKQLKTYVEFRKITFKILEAYILMKYC